MFYQGQMMNQNDGSCGCNSGCPVAAPTCQQCNQVVQTCNVQDVPHYTNYHTHVVNNCIKRHINIPTYSTSTENVMINEYVQGQPIYQQPIVGQQPVVGQQPILGQQPMYTNPMGQGVAPMTAQPEMPGVNPSGYQGMVNPMGQTPFNF